MASAATRPRRKPARMTLSENVARNNDKGRRSERSGGPYAGMNRKATNIKTIDARKSIPSKSAPKNKEERPLYHALKMQAVLSPLSYGQRNALKEKLASITSFNQFALRDEVRNAIRTQALPGLETLEPTPAQSLAIPALLKDSVTQKRNKADQLPYDQFLIAAETGSGKTLAYLLPVINSIKQQEDIDRSEAATKAEKEACVKELKRMGDEFYVEPPEVLGESYSTAGRPRALILLPSSELVSQVGKVVKAMSHVVKFRSAPISAANSPTVIRNRLFNENGIDIVVSTPHLISSIAEKEPNILSRLQYLVVDEADSLLDRSFSATTCSIIDRAAPSLKQLILCSATIPRSLENFLDKRYPEIKRLVTPHLHAIPRRVQLGRVDIEKEPYRGNRSLACADVIWQLGRSLHDDGYLHHTMKNIIVFVNERETAEEVARYLETKGIDVVALTRDTSEQRSGEVLSHFTSPVRVEGDKKQKEVSDGFLPFAETFTPDSKARSPRRLANTKVLVTTDLGSRGIDTLAVRNVILYDIPHTTIDFVHRLGRLGRMGRRGRAVALIGRKDRKDVVREVKEAMHRGQPLI